MGPQPLRSRIYSQNTLNYFRMKELARWRRSYGDQGRLVFQPEYQPIHHSNEFLYAFVAPTVSKNYTYSKGLDTSSFFP